MRKLSIYIIGSLRNPQIGVVANSLRRMGYDAFDSWYAAGPEADDYWKKYCESKGMSYIEGLKDYSAQNVFEFDKRHIDRCDMAMLVLPAGKSGHLELGYAAGRGKKTFILLPEDHDRWDVMYNFATAVIDNVQQMEDYI